MGKSQDALLHFSHRYFLLRRLFEDIAKIIGEEDAVHQNPDIVEQPRQVNVFRPLYTEFVTQASCDKSRAQRMAPEHLFSDAGFQVHKHHRQAAGENQIPDSPQSQRKHRFPHGRDIAASPEQRRSSGDRLKAALRPRFRENFVRDLKRMIGRWNTAIDCGLQQHFL
jgi:hypothetical protein